MFIKVHENNNPVLAFVRSSAVRAFPCGRRRSTLVPGNGNGEKGGYYIPFDPEAKLNTEANNRKHSGANGFTQTYLQWVKTKDTELYNDTMQIVMAGYTFDIDVSALGAGKTTPSEFAESLISKVGNTSRPEAIYANILIEETALFSDSGNNLNYSTNILRCQSGDDSVQLSDGLDLLLENTYATDSVNYYFSGLSFSVEPESDDVENTRSIRIIKKTDDHNQQTWVSLRILEKVNDTWQIHQPALLPNIEHGEEENSIKTGSITATNIAAAGKISSSSISTGELRLSSDNNNDKYRVPALDVVEDPGTGEWQLKFYYEANN